MVQQFDKAAKTYNRFASIQAISADKLLNGIAPCSPKTVLDIGCGTGLLTKTIASQYPTAIIDAVDVSSNMINELASQKISNINTSCSDFNQQTLSKKYDMIVSNAAIHWMDVDLSLRQMANYLIPNGTCYIAIFGSKTSFELNHCLAKINRNHNLIAKTFPDSDDLVRLGQRYFLNWTVKTECLTLTFDSIIQLLKTQKNTGVNYKQRPEGLWTPSALKAFEEAMIERYGIVQLSYEIHYCKGSI